MEGEWDGVEWSGERVGCVYEWAKVVACKMVGGRPGDCVAFGVGGWRLRRELGVDLYDTQH